MQLYNLHLLCGIWGATGSTEEEQIGTTTAANAHSCFHTKQLKQSEPYFNSHTPPLITFYFIYDKKCDWRWIVGHFQSSIVGISQQ